jgi:hypothetical protein
MMMMGNIIMEDLFNNNVDISMRNRLLGDNDEDDDDTVSVCFFRLLSHDDDAVG